jgi:hypothetical protein
MDAYASIHALERAKALATDANGAESRWLLQGDDQASEELFHQLASKIVNSNVDAKLAAKILSDYKDKLISKNDIANAGLTEGCLVEELNNITYGSVEQNDAIASLETWGEYYEIDGKIRALERQSGLDNSKHNQAIALCLGESNVAFAAFTRKLDETIEVNRNAFNDALNDGKVALGSLNWCAPAIALIVIALSAAGLWPRFSEYRA